MKIVKPATIKKEKWDLLKLIEKALVYFLCKRRYTQSELMKKLYIENSRTFRRLKAKVREKLRTK